MFVGVTVVPPPLAAVLTTLTFVVVVGLVAYRLLWAAPYLAKLGVVPESWRRWIFDEPSAKKPN